MFLVRFMVLVPAFALAALAENIAFTSWPECLKVGQPATVKWAGGNSEVSHYNSRPRFGPANDEM